MHQSVLKLCLVVELSLLCGGCSNGNKYNELYGVAYNTEREKRGIPAVLPDWIAEGFGDYINYGFDWSKANSELTKEPHHLRKQVFVDKNGGVTQEWDFFYSGKTFKHGVEEETEFEGITLTYDYARQNSGNPWSITANLAPDQWQKELTLQEADRILESWGLSRTSSAASNTQ